MSGAATRWPSRFGAWTRRGGLDKISLVTQGNEAGGIPVHLVGSPAYSTAVYGPPAAPQPTLAAIPSSTLAKGTFAVKATLTNPTAGAGTIYCTDGSTRPFTLNVGNFWYRAGQNGNPANVLLASVDYANYPTGSSGHEVYVFERSVPLEQGKTVEAVTLPPLGDVVGTTRRCTSSPWPSADAAAVTTQAVPSGPAEEVAGPSRAYPLGDALGDLPVRQAGRERAGRRDAFGH